MTRGETFGTGPFGWKWGEGMTAAAFLRTRGKKNPSRADWLVEGRPHRGGEPDGQTQGP